MSRRDPHGAVVSWVDRPPAAGPLEGLRVAVKDVIAVRGVPRLCGAANLVDRSPQDADAWCVARLADAGAHIVATTSTPPFAYGVTTPGTTNPVAPHRTVGGSSGGSAAAVAAGLVDAALGTDTAGSVRIPAACCGVVGLKTTQGSIERTGVHPLAPTLDTVGVLARDVDTLRLVTAPLVAAPPPEPRAGPLRVGVLDEVTALPMAHDVRQAWSAASAALADAGASVASVTIPTFHDSHAARGRILAAEALRVLDPIVAGRRGAPAALRAALERARDLPTDDVLAARRTGAHLRDRLVGLFGTVDVLVLPVFACLVPSRDAVEVDVAGHTERVTSALTRLTGPWNLAGVPAGVVPIGPDSDGAPLAVQIVARWHAERTILDVLALFERAGDLSAQR